MIYERGKNALIQDNTSDKSTERERVEEIQYDGGIHKGICSK